MAVFFKLRVSGHKVNLTKLQELFAGKKYDICNEGTAHVDPYTKTETVYPEDVFLLEREFPDEMPVEKALKTFLLELEPQKQDLKAMSEQAHVMLWASLFPKGYHTNLCFKSETLNLIQEFGLECNFEISFLEEIYQGKTEWE